MDKAIKPTTREWNVWLKHDPEMCQTFEAASVSDAKTQAYNILDGLVLGLEWIDLRVRLTRDTVSKD
jgi:hypothetical protein